MYLNGAIATLLYSGLTADRFWNPPRQEFEAMNPMKVKSAVMITGLLLLSLSQSGESMVTTLHVIVTNAYTQQ